MSNARHSCSIHVMSTQLTVPSLTFHTKPFSEQIHAYALLRLSMYAPKKSHKYELIPCPEFK